MRASAISVLVVDDLQDQCEMYAEYLSHLGMDVSTAASGPEALKKAVERHPHVIVLDISMPQMEGDEVARQLRGDARTADIHLVALTAFGFLARQKARAAGFEAFCRKPCNPRELAEVVESLAFGPEPDIA